MARLSSRNCRCAELGEAKPFLKLTGNEEEDDGGGDEQLLEAGLLADPEDEPPEGEPDDDAEDAGDGDGLGLHRKYKIE